MSQHLLFLVLRYLTIPNPGTVNHREINKEKSYPHRFPKRARAYNLLFLFLTGFQELFFNPSHSGMPFSP